MPKDSFIKNLRNEMDTLLDDQRFAGATVHRFQKFIHFWILVGRSFVRNRCPVRASALAYTTLLALIPLLAVGIGVSTSLLKGQGKEPVDQLIHKLVDEVAPQLGLMPLNTQEGNDARAEVIKRIQGFIANVNSGALGITGTVALILVAVGLLSNIEKTLNDIWGVTRGRSWFSRLVQYWAAITLGPLLMILAVGLTLGGNLQTFQARIEGFSPLVAKIFFGGFALFAPYLILMAAFMLIYMLMPNTKVHWHAALAGAVVGSILWNLNSQFNVVFASRVVTASKIYGPLGAVPVFLIGLYFSWLIMLFGAQVAYAVQNRRVYLQEIQAEAVNQRGREFIAFRVMAYVGNRFLHGEKAMTSTQIGNALDVPTRLVHQVAHVLVGGGLLVEVSSAGALEVAYDPARPLEKINCHDIITVMRAGQGHELATRAEPLRDAVLEKFQQIQECERQLSETITVLDLAKLKT